MRKYSISALVLMIASFGLFLSSCKSHETPAKPKLSFAEATKTVKESDGTIDVTLKLDKAADQDVTVSYQLSGTADDKVTAGSNAAYDYEIVGSYLETKILKGETEGKISIKLWSDFYFENPETIVVHIQDVDSQGIEITRDDDCTITVNQEDGLGIFLDWGIHGEHYTDVDMDLFLWTQDPYVLTAASWTDTTLTGEFIFAPTALGDGTVGLSANYYAGTADPMNFEFKFITYTDGVEGTPVIKAGVYHSANVNPWTNVSDIDQIIVETFQITGGTFGSFSDVTPADVGSRVGSSRTAASQLQTGPAGARYQNLILPRGRKK